MALSVVIIGTFIAHQRELLRQGKRPLLELRLFTDRAFSAGLLTQLTFWCGQAAFFFVLALYLQLGRGLDALQAGAVFTIMATAYTAYLVTSLRAPRLTLRYGRRLIALGALVQATGHVLLLLGAMLSGTDGWLGLLVPGLVLVGAGMGLLITPLVTTVLSAVQPEQAGAASGTISTVQQVGNALGVAVTGVLFFGTLGGGYPHAFELSVAEFTVLLALRAGLARLLPGPNHVRAAV